jgi:hypothetical protein
LEAVSEAGQEESADVYDGAGMIEAANEAFKGGFGALAVSDALLCVEDPFFGFVVSKKDFELVRIN